jgi:hypothetical protein
MEDANTKNTPVLFFQKKKKKKKLTFALVDPLPSRVQALFFNF